MPVVLSPPVPARRGIIRSVRAHPAARAGHSIAAAHATGAAAAGEIRGEGVVVPHGNVELGAEVWMARHRDGDVPQLPFAFPGIMGKRHNAFLIGSHNTRRDSEVLPQNFAMACTLRL